MKEHNLNRQEIQYIHICIILTILLIKLLVIGRQFTQITMFNFMYCAVLMNLQHVKWDKSWCPNTLESM